MLNEPSDFVITVATIVTVLISYIFVSRWRQRRADGQRRAVVVTGAGAGIGRASVEQLLRLGDTVFALDSNGAALDALAQEDVAPGRLFCIVCDVSSTNSVDAAAASVRQSLAANKDLPSLHAIVNLAGIFGGGPLMEADSDQVLERVLSINTVGPQRVARAFFPLLRQHGATNASTNASTNARIVNVASEISMARMSPCLTAPYSMSKWAVEAFSIALRQELSMLSPPVHVVTLQPGPILTQLSGAQTTDVALALAAKGSLWKGALLAQVTTAEAYVGFYGQPAERAGRAVVEVVHAVVPPRSLPVNATLAMRAAAWTPQPVLDMVARHQACAAPPRAS